MEGGGWEGKWGAGSKDKSCTHHKHGGNRVNTSIMIIIGYIMQKHSPVRSNGEGLTKLHLTPSHKHMYTYHHQVANTSEKKILRSGKIYTGHKRTITLAHACSEIHHLTQHRTNPLTHKMTVAGESGLHFKRSKTKAN